MKNTKFEAASKDEKRVMIAKDVIAQVRKDFYVPSYGTWVAFSEFLPAATSLQKILTKKKDFSCKVCAMGGLMLSAVKYNNSVTLGNDRAAAIYYADAGGAMCDLDDSASKNLRKFFIPSQLDLIEAAFEVGEGAVGLPINKISRRYKSTSAAIAFGENYPDPKNRIIAIMKNIIKNNGTFVPVLD
jgi:hypothetical protein